MRSIYTMKIWRNFFFFNFRNIIVKTFLKCNDSIFFLMYLSKRKRIYLITTRISCRSVLLIILFISNILFKLILWMIFIISRRVIDVSLWINKKYLYFSIFFMNTVDEIEKWTLIMISILFCVVIINFSHFFNNKMIVCNIILFSAFLTHFVTSKSFLKHFSEACIIAWNLFFYVMLLFYSFDHKFLYTFVIRWKYNIRVSNVVFFWLYRCIFEIIQILLVRKI